MKSAKIVSIVALIIGVALGLTSITIGVMSKNRLDREPMIINGVVLIILFAFFSRLLWYIGSRPIDIDDEEL